MSGTVPLKWRHSGRLGGISARPHLGLQDGLDLVDRQRTLGHGRQDRRMRLADAPCQRRGRGVRA